MPYYCNTYSFRCCFYALRLVDKRGRCMEWWPNLRLLRNSSDERQASSESGESPTWTWSRRPNRRFCPVPLQSQPFASPIPLTESWIPQLFWPVVIGSSFLWKKMALSHSQGLLAEWHQLWGFYPVRDIDWGLRTKWGIQIFFKAALLVIFFSKSQWLPSWILKCKMIDQLKTSIILLVTLTVT